MDSCDNIAADLSNVSVSSPQQQKQRQQSSQEQTKSTDRDYHPLLNDCVLRTCFKYLSVKTVANCRLVSKFWNQAACSYLRQKSVVKFKFAEEIYGFTNVMESCADSPYQRFILHIFEHEIEHPLVKLLFERFGASITSITFDLQGNSRYAFKAPDPKVLKSLLELPRIEEIRLYGLPDLILRESQLFDTNSFPLLKTFSFSIYQDKYGINRTNSEDEVPLVVLKSDRALIFNIIESARNLQFLEIGSIHSDCASLLFQQEYLPRMTTFKTLPLNVSSFRTESLIQMGGACPNLTSLSCFLDLNTTSDEVYRLLNKVPLLKYLKLRGGKVVTDIPVMPALKEVHLLIVCTLPLKTLMEKLPEVRIATVLLKSTDYLLLEKGGQDGSVIFSNKLQALQVSLQEGLHLIDFLGRIRLNFPCLSSLRLRATSEIMKEIFRNLSTLEELYIDEGSTVSDQDITGISSDDLYSDTEDQDDINVNRTGFYIGDLKRLKRLFLGSIYITNASIYYGLADLRELTYVSLREPVELIAGNGKHFPISGHIFSLYPLVCQLSYLIRVELRESRFRSRTGDLPVILPDEIHYIRALRPHLQLVYVSICSAQGDEKITYY